MGLETQQAPNVTPAPAGHDAAMIAKVDANQAAAAAGQSSPPPAPATPQRPADVPEKFWNAEKGEVNTAALLKSYGDLERGKAAPPVTPEVPPAATPETKAAEAAVGADKFATFSSEFAEKGELTAESYDALAKDHGISKEMVDAYIAGQKAMATSAVSSAYELVGGEQQYATMLDWAGKNLSPAEAEVFDRSVMDGNDASMKQAVLGLKSRYEAAYGSSQAGMVNGAAAAGEVGYGSQAEMTRDMKDPRYKADPAYRRGVERRLEVTTAF